MNTLTFSGAGSVRSARFEERSIVPVSVACVVANGVRERLGSLCGAEVDLRLWPPAIPQHDGWAAILREALVYGVRGSLADAAFVLRAPEAGALAALLFGEPDREPHERALSRIETEIARRAVAALAPTLAPVCGEVRFDERVQAQGAVTYFELHVVSPCTLCIGIALSREPAPAAARCLETTVVKKARLDARVELRLHPIPAHAVASLRAGDVLVARSSRAVLRANGAALARGACGVRAGRYAFRCARSA